LVWGVLDFFTDFLVAFLEAFFDLTFLALVWLLAAAFLVTLGLATDAFALGATFLVLAFLTDLVLVCFLAFLTCLGLMTTGLISLILWAVCLWAALWCFLALGLLMCLDFFIYLLALLRALRTESCFFFLARAFFKAALAAAARLAFLTALACLAFLAFFALSSRFFCWATLKAVLVTSFIRWRGVSYNLSL